MLALIGREAKSYERFLKRVYVTPTQCWQMKGWHDKDGYAHFHKSKHKSKAHRISYEWHKGKIPDGLTIDHLCKNKGCVNPDHLEAVTTEENASRHNAEGYKNWWKELPSDKKQEFIDNVCVKGSLKAAAIKKAATHCRRGHEWKPETTYIVPSNGHRRCNVCFYSSPSMIKKRKKEGR
jgi:hypothetical protein